MGTNNFGIIQAMNSFKKLNRKFRKEYNNDLLNRLIELDRYIAENNIRWFLTYGR